MVGVTGPSILRHTEHAIEGHREHSFEKEGVKGVRLQERNSLEHALEHLSGERVTLIWLVRASGGTTFD